MPSLFKKSQSSSTRFRGSDQAALSAIANGRYTVALSPTPVESVRYYNSPSPAASHVYSPPSPSSLPVPMPRTSVPMSPAVSTAGSYDSRSTASTARTSVSSASSIPGASLAASPQSRRLRFKDLKIELTAEDAIAVKETYDETLGLSQQSNGSSASGLGTPANLFYGQFYQNLFAVRPDLEFMFPDIRRQSAAISGIFTAALAMLESISALDDILQRLGRRHAYVMGIEAEHFELFGGIFIQTLRDRMGERFRPQIEITWVKIYAYLAGKMVAAGNDEDDELADAMIGGPAVLMPSAAPLPMPVEKCEHVNSPYGGYRTPVQPMAAESRQMSSPVTRTSRPTATSTSRPTATSRSTPVRSEKRSRKSTCSIM
ncbi:globin-like protein [Limtongia smithiae]|uniref:globin-like protein n=1 Tax=Limtongia smithiae TaxID=1125753 RepID=UPI0034CFA549